MQTKTKWIIGIVVIIVAVGVYFSDISLQKGALKPPTGRQPAQPALDMKVTNVSIDRQTLRTGDQVTISATVMANALSLASTTSLTIDTNRQPDVPTGALNNSTATATWAWTAVEGTHTLVACADASSRNTEINETNNCKSATVLVSPPLPDLTINDIQLVPSDAFGWVGVRVYARNQGGPVQTLPNGVWPSLNMHIGFNVAGETVARDEEIDSQSDIAGGIQSAVIPLPHGTLPPSFSVTATIDNDGSIGESNESNNTLTKMLEVPTRLLPLPDLVINDIRLVPSDTLGWVGVRVYARNQGEPVQTLPNGVWPSLNIHVVFSIAGETIARDEEIDSQSDIAGGIQLAVIPLPRGTLPSSSFQVTATIDSNGNIGESNESNNTLTKTLLVPATLPRSASGQ